MPSDRAIRIINLADSYMKQSYRAEGVEATVYTGDQAITTLLGAILVQLEDLQAAVEKLAK